VRKIILQFNNIDYFAFQKVANESGLTPEEKLKEIVEYYLIIERNRKKFTQKLLG
jgi:hypothetical protein